MNNFYIRLAISVFILCNPFFIFAKKILLTGGAGFIGSHVAQELLRRGDSVILVDNFNDAYDLSIKQHNVAMVKLCDLNDQLTIYPIDICDIEKMTDVFSVESLD